MCVCVYKGGYGPWALTLLSYAERFYLGIMSRGGNRGVDTAMIAQVVNFSQALTPCLSTLQPVRGLYLHLQ